MWRLPYLHVIFFGTDQARVMFSISGLVIVLSGLVFMAAMDTDDWQEMFLYLTLILITIYCSLNAFYQATFLGNAGRFPPRSANIFTLAYVIRQNL